MRRAFSVAVFILNGNEVLLIKHKRLDLWLPVGGEREGDETPIETACREVKEETGLEVEFPVLGRRLHGCPPGYIGYDEHEAGNKGLHMNFNFVAISSTREIVSDGSFTEHGWFSPLSMSNDRPPVPSGVRDCLNRIQQYGQEERLPGVDPKWGRL